MILKNSYFIFSLTKFYNLTVLTRLSWMENILCEGAGSWAAVLLLVVGRNLPRAARRHCYSCTSLTSHSRHRRHRWRQRPCSSVSGQLCHSVGLRAGATRFTLPSPGCYGRWLRSLPCARLRSGEIALLPVGDVRCHHHHHLSFIKSWQTQP